LIIFIAPDILSAHRHNRRVLILKNNDVIPTDFHFNIDGQYPGIRATGRAGCPGPGPGGSEAVSDTASRAAG
jgi:hypothetical protein